MQVAPAVASWLHESYFFSRNVFWKIFFSLCIALRRLVQFCWVPFADIVFIQKPLMPPPWPALEPLIARWSRKMVFDFDDAIFLPSPFATRKLSAQALSSRFQKIVGCADLVLAGNGFLAQEATKFVSRVEVLPTVVDSQRFFSKATKLRGTDKKAGELVIGWMGSPTTAFYLDDIREVIVQLSRKFMIQWNFVGAGAWAMEDTHVTVEPWKYETEVAKLQSFDIFISPLRATSWENGKCGLKTLTAMSAGLPVIASAVGVHKDIIQDGANGFLAASPSEWKEKLSRLLSDPSLRAQLGGAARKTIQQNYDLTLAAHRLAEILKTI